MSKLIDSDAENSETEVWLDFAFGCDYINEKEHADLLSKVQEVRRLLGDIINNPGKYS